MTVSFYFSERGEEMAFWRLFLFSGALSVLIGIFYVTSLIETESEGLHTWGFFLLFWGIAATMVSFQRINVNSLIKGLAAIGIFLHGSVSIYWILFPNVSETDQSFNAIFLFAFPEVLIALICLYILGINAEKKYDKMK
jgi:uncharacterized membrane protein HdeD (DUF308 family)